MIKKFKRIALNNPIFIICWPGMGEVAIKAGFFLRDTLRFKPFARIVNSGCFQPQGIISEKGVVEMPHIEEGVFYFYKDKNLGHDIVLFLAEAQPPMDKAYQFAKKIVDFAVAANAFRVFTFAAFPQAIEHTQSPSVWVSATDRQLLNRFSKYKVKTLTSGQISGLNGLVLGVAKQHGIKGACLLGEIPFYTIQIENPKTTLSVLSVLADFLGLKFNFDKLRQRSKFLEKEINKLISYLKGEATGKENLPLSEADIQKMKKELDRFSKLPQSAREKIEGLFKKAFKDISYASELKKVLDEWNVYKEYEDRFLDLFKKKRFDH